MITAEARLDQFRMDAIHFSVGFPVSFEKIRPFGVGARTFPQEQSMAWAQNFRADAVLQLRITDLEGGGKKGGLIG